MLRRQQVLHQDVQLSIIEDYAHHPNEITSLLSSLRSQASEKKIGGGIPTTSIFENEAV